MEDYATWQAAYNDGTVVNQKDDGASYDSIDREKLAGFSLVRPDGTLIIHIPVTEGKGSRIIWRRRRQVVPGVGEVWYYIIGKRGAFVALVNPNYEVLIDDNFHEDNMLLGDVAAVDGEEV